MAYKCRGSFLLESNILMSAFTETKTKKQKKKNEKKKIRKRKIQRYHHSTFTVRYGI